MKPARKLSRRDFAFTAAFAAAAVAIVPPDSMAQQPPGTPVKTPAKEEEKPALSSSLQTEAEERIAALLRRHGHRLSQEQKAEIRKQITDGMHSVERLRAFPLGQGDEPATILRPIRRSARP